jgi:propanediol utilization protein
MKIPVEISARHVHLSKNDAEKLFGKNYKLKPVKFLSQPGEFASKETITIVNGNNKIENVRILGPFREKSQVELSLTDAYNLKLNPLPSIKVSGDLSNTTKILVKNNSKTIKIPVIIAQRHLHCSEEQAKKLNLKNNKIIKIKISGKRGLIFDNVITRVNQNFRLSVHLDTDEANSAGIKGKTFGNIIK